MDKFGHIIVQIWNLNPKVSLHSMLLALWPSKSAGSLCKKSPSSMNELCEWAKDYIQMKEMSKFRNRVQQAAQKHNKKGGSKTDSHKRHKPDKCQPLPKGPRYEH